MRGFISKLTIVIDIISCNTISLWFYRKSEKNTENIRYKNTYFNSVSLNVI